MIISANTSNQVRIQDPDEDQVWFDVHDNADFEPVTITTRRAADEVYTAVVLNDADLDAVIAHLTAIREARRPKPAAPAGGVTRARITHDVVLDGAQHRDSTEAATALGNLASVMSVQAEDGLYLSGNPDDDETFVGPNMDDYVPNRHVADFVSVTTNVEVF